MQKNEIEKKIKERFDELSSIFPERISREDARVCSILDFFGNINGLSILDAGCGKGRFSGILKENGANVTGVDVSEELLRPARNNLEGINFVQGSVANLPFADDSFDCVLSVEVIEHVLDRRKAVEEMVRVLKKGGKIVIIDKNKMSLHRRFFLPNALIKKYMEVSGKWFYPKDFEFAEKWFFPSDIDKLLKKYCGKAEVEHIIDSKKKLFSLFPFLNLFIAWKGVK